MKKNKIICWLFLFFVVIVEYSCKDATIHEKKFPIVQNVNAKYIHVNEIIKIGNIYKLDNYIILRDAQENANAFFYVYSYPEFNFLYSFAQKGNGANEYLMPTVIKNTPNNKFAFRDHATDKYVTFQITDTLAIVVDEYRFTPKDSRFFWEINYVGANEYMLKRNNSRQSSCDLWDLKERLLLDTLPNSFNLADEMGENYYTEFDDYWLSVSDGHFSLAYFFIDRIELGKIEGKKLKQRKVIGATKTPDFFLFTNSKLGGKYKYNVDNNVVYYEDLTSTHIGVYGLYAGVPWGDIERCHSSLIEVYDWEGNAVKLLKLSESISSLVVCEKEKRIYGINPDTNEDTILIFEYN